jgi:hypothetical protein
LQNFRWFKITSVTFEEALLSVWQQALVDDSTVVKLGGESYPVHRTRKRSLRQVDFVFQGRKLRGLEQNPDTKSRWAQLARSGKQVMQFLGESGYLAVVFGGRITLYGEARSDAKSKKIIS